MVQEVLGQLKMTISQPEIARQGTDPAVKEHGGKILSMLNCLWQSRPTIDWALENTWNGGCHGTSSQELGALSMPSTHIDARRTCLAVERIAQACGGQESAEQYSLNRPKLLEAR